MARLTPYDDYLLRTYFGADRLFFRSPIGGMLDHMRARSSDSSGHKIPRARPWCWRPDGTEPVIFADVGEGTKAWDAGTYEVSDTAMRDVGGAARRLRAITPTSYVVLGRYYGDAGAMWAAASQDRKGKRKDKEVVLYSGIGPGAIAALYPLTAAGRALIEFERKLGEGASSAKKLAEREQEVSAHRASVEATVAQKEAALLALGDDREQKAAELGMLRVEEVEARDATSRVPASLRSRIERAQSDIITIRRAREDLRRDILRLRLQLVYSASTATTNPQPDDGWREALAERRRLTTIYETELATWTEIKEDLERVCGKMEDNDKRLPPKPTIDLPQISPARTHARGTRPPEAHMSDDDRLHVAFVLAKSLAGDKSTITRRRALLLAASSQAQDLLVTAWAEWIRSGNRRPPGHPTTATPTNDSTPPPASGPRCTDRYLADRPVDHATMESA